MAKAKIKISKKDINLLPKEYKKRKIASSVNTGVSFKTLIIVFIISCIAVGGCIVGLFIGKGILTKVDDGYKADIAKYSVVNDIIKQNDDTKTAIQKRENFESTAFGKYTKTRILGILGGAIPSNGGVKFTSFICDSNTVQVIYNSKDLSTSADYIKSIRKLGLYATIKGQQFQCAKSGPVSTTIQCSLSPIPLPIN